MMNMLPSQMTEVKCVIGAKLGSGTYGDVYQVTDKEVIKIYKDVDPNKATQIDSTAELDILFRLRSPFLLKGLAIQTPGACYDPNGSKIQSLSLRMELLTGQSFNLVKHISYSKLKEVFLHYALGLRCMHRNNYLHLDLKPYNMMYGGTQDNPIGVLIDFGLALGTYRGADNKLMPIRSSDVRITCGYRPPECLRDDHVYSDKADIWSLGISYLEFLTGKFVYDYNKDQQFIDEKQSDGKVRKVHSHEKTSLLQFQKLADPTKIRKNLEAYMENIPKEDKKAFTDLMVGMLDLDQVKRFDIERVIDDKFFSTAKEKVKEFPGNHCDSVLVKQSISEVVFDQSRYDGLQFLLSLLQTYWRFARTEMLFCSVDVYMRAIAGIGPNVNMDTIKDVAKCSILITHRLFYGIIDIPEAVFQSLSAWKLEPTIIQYLGGIIRRPYLYDACESVDELVSICHHLFRNNDLKLLHHYLHIDINAYVQSVRESLPSNKTRSLKSQRISKFMEMCDGTYELLKYRDQVWERFYGELISSPLNEAKLEYLFSSVDIFMRLLIKDPNENYGNLAAIAMDLAIESLPENRNIDVKSFSKTDPALSKLRSKLDSANLYTNRAYHLAKSADELLMFRKYFPKMIDDHYYVFDSYHNLDFEKELKRYAKGFILGNTPKTITIAEFMKLPEPKPIQTISPKIKAT